MLPKYFGFCNPSELPVLSKDRITIPANTCYFSKGVEYCTVSSYEITVKSVVNGLSVYVGFTMFDDDTILWSLTTAEYEEIKLVHGTNNLEKLLPLMKAVKRDNYFALYLPMRNPMVFWKMHGNFCETDINQLFQ
jgi:hypothetical protein